SQPPAAPSNLGANATSSSVIALSWSSSTDNVGIAGYRVFRVGTTAAIGTTTATTYSDTGRAAGTTYSYTVVAFDAAGNVSPSSNQASATTPAPDTQPPSTPTNLSAGVGRNRTVTLSWSASTDNVGVAGYRVYRNGVQVAQVGGTSASDRPSRGSG